jgi:Subunit ChlI of Mg-chelatase
VNLGLPGFTIVGLTDRAIHEARERVKPAIRNASFEFPQRRVTVNLAPAEVPKEGTGFDLTDGVPVRDRPDRRADGLAPMPRRLDREHETGDDERSPPAI